MNITVRGATEVKRLLSNLEQRQIPFAMAKAVNDVTLEARDYLKDRNRQSFIIRRPWVLNGWRVRLANKRQAPIKATLWLDPSRDFLAKFQEGGSKQSRSGSSLAVPLDARKGKRGLVPAALRIRALQLRKHVTKHGKMQLKGNDGSFTVRTATHTLVLQRKGKRVDTLYVFKRAVPIPSSLRFFETVGAYVTNEWPKVMGEALAHAIRTAR